MNIRETHECVTWLSIKNNKVRCRTPTPIEGTADIRFDFNGSRADFLDALDNLADEIKIEVAKERKK